ISSTINLGSAFAISGFEERLYDYTGTAPIVGPISGARDFWTSPQGSSGTVAILPQTFLPQGTYVLEIRGDVTGGTGGAYRGPLQVPPVPSRACGGRRAAAGCGRGPFTPRLGRLPSIQAALA